jgi:dipeptidyl aminopeptidase/acylaminoacyl peptidase
VPYAGVDLSTLVKPELMKYRAHDGPEGQERPAFRSDYQALLTQGIGVFAPNVRGSSGFGKTFVNLDNGALRVEGVKDIKDSVVTEFPELFAAGVNLFGIVNFATFFAHSEPWMAAISTIEYGDPATQAGLLAQLSPIHKLDRIKAAMMVQHGANDTNVPVVEAEQIVTKLKQRGFRWNTSSSPTKATDGGRSPTASARSRRWWPSSRNT